MHAQSTCDKGFKVFLSGSLYLTEGFSAHDNHDTDCSSHPNFLATRAPCSNEATKEAMESMKAFTHSAADAKNFACAFHIDSLEKNDHTMTGKENTFFMRFQLEVG